MSITTLLAEAATEHHGNVALETVGFGIVAIVAFAALGLVVFTYRDVANRHSGKSAAYAKRHAAEIEHGAGHGH